MTQHPATELSAPDIVVQDEFGIACVKLSSFNGNRALIERVFNESRW